MLQSYVIFDIYLYKAQILKTFQLQFSFIKTGPQSHSFNFTFVFLCVQYRSGTFFLRLQGYTLKRQTMFFRVTRVRNCFCYPLARKQEVLFFGFRRSMCLIFRVLYLQHFLMFITWTNLGQKRFQDFQKSMGLILNPIQGHSSILCLRRKQWDHR